MSCGKCLLSELNAQLTNETNKTIIIVSHVTSFPSPSHLSAGHSVPHVKGTLDPKQ